MPEGALVDVLAGQATWCVLHGDCLEVLASLSDKSCVVVGDPPYGVGKAIAGDKMAWEDWLPWFDARTAECVRVGLMVYQFFASTRLIRFVRETTVPPQFEINWHKPMMLHDTSLNGSPFLAHRESILYWGPTSPKIAGKRGYDSVAYNAMWPSERRKAGIDHPTPKPESLMVRSMERWTNPDHLVVDPWCGSGTTGVAALRLGRRFVGIEIDERWVDLARRRLQAEESGGVLPSLTGQAALTFGGGDG